MPDNLPLALASANRALVVAPAGCGKTHLISQAVRHCKGRQLVLTHTHAGVRSIKDKMARLEVSADRFHVSTLASFGLRYAASYPTISGWNVPEPEDDQWSAVLPAAGKSLCARTVERVLRASYTGVFVDEYQDCTRAQHQLVTQLATVLPCRVLGDPLQSVFAQVNGAEALPWADVQGTFPEIATLTTPHRWTGKNEALGHWLLDARVALLRDQTIDLTSVDCVRFVSTQNAPYAPLAECKRLLKYYPSPVLVMRRHRAQCHKLAASATDFTVFEDANGVDLLKWARRLDETSGPKRVQAVADFAAKWLSGLSKPAVLPVVAAVTSGNPCKAKRPDLLTLAGALVNVRDSQDIAAIPPALDAFMGLKEGPVFTSRETWLGLHQAVRHAQAGSATPLRDAVWRERDRQRRNGRCPPVRCLGTPLLVKGLEFDHTLILNIAEFPDSESLYVALTRSSRSLTIVGQAPLLPPPKAPAPS